MKNLFPLLLVLLLLALPGAALAQGAQETLTLRLTRDWGYGGFNNDIQGRFSYRVEGPDTLERVEFHLDDEVIGEATEAPFNFQFETDDYPPGEHVLYAIGYTSDGQELISNEYARVFLSADEAGGAMGSIIIPLIVGVAAVAALSYLISTFVFKRGKISITPGQYGIAGGAVCKQCELPFPRTVWMPNMLVGKLARCPHCGKVAIVPRASKQQLEEAEARLMAGDPSVADKRQESAEERLRRQIDDSRYD